MSAHLTQLFTLLYSERRIDELFKAVDQTRERMEKAGEGEIWKVWRVIALASRGDFAEAEGLMKSIRGDYETEAKRALTTERARQTKDWQPVLEFLGDQWRKTGAPADLLALCEAYLQSGSPQFVAEHASEIVERIATPAALRLALAGAARAENHSLCLELLQKHASLFPDGKLPTDLRRLRISCEESLGLLGEAAKDAEELVREEASAENLSVLFRLRVAVGDLKAAVFPARELVHSHKTPAHLLVQIASVMRLEDKALATKALEQAAARDITGPGPLGLATLTAAQLNLDELMRQLIPKMAEEAAKESPLLRTATLGEMVEMHRIGQEQFVKAIDEWRQGKVPIHFLRRWTNLPLATWSCMALSYSPNEGNISPNIPVFFRHGGRSADPTERKIKRLYPDITALHISFQLGILPLIERECGPLFLPAAVRRSLVQQADDANRNQPNLVEARHAVAQLIDSGRIEIWPHPKQLAEEQAEREGIPVIWWKQIDEAVRRNGLFVDYWPILRRDNTRFEPSGVLLKQVTGLAQILKVLVREGKIENHHFNKANERLAPQSQSTGELPLPNVGQTLLLHGNISEQLATSGILDATAATFRLVMSELDVVSLRAEITRHNSWQRVSEHVRELREHILASANYRDLILKETSESKQRLEVNDPAEECLTELLHAESGEGHFVWIDDRNINAFPGCGTVPTITTLGLLDNLRHNKKLSDDQFHAIRHRLRLSDFRFIPLSCNDIIYHLSRAPIRDGRLIETPELVALRQYYARVLLDASALQFPPVDPSNPNQMGETNMLMAHFHATSDAFLKLFADGSNNSPGTEFAQADWILANLWLEPGHLGPAVGRTLPQNEYAAKLIGIGDSLLIHRAIGTHGLSDSKRKLYFQWLENRVLADETRAKNAAEHVSQTLEGQLWRRGKNSTERKLYAAIMSNWFLALPEQVSEMTKLSHGTRQALALTTKSALTVAGVQFDSNEFWEAAESAYTGGLASLQSLDRMLKFDVAIKDHGRTRSLLLKKQGDTKSLNVQDDVLLLLEPSQKDRVEALKRHPEWFDAFGNSSTNEIQRVAQLKTFTAKVFAIESARKKSAWHHYTSLRAICQSTNGPTLQQMVPPEPSILSKFLRLPTRFKKKEVSQAFDKIAMRLLSEVGLIEAFDRLSTLPRELPRIILESFRRLPREEKRNFVEKVNSGLITPLSRIHLLDLLLQAGDEFKTEAIALASVLLSEEQVRETSALLRVVTWTWSQMKSEARIDDSTGIRRLVLSWIHGSILFGMLRKISDAETVEDFMQKYAPLTRRPSELIVRMDGEDDFIFPHKVQPNVLLVTGVGGAFYRAKQNANGLDASLVAKARALCFHERDSVQFPQSGWLTVPGLLSDMIGSFLGAPRQTVLAPLLGDELSSTLSTERMLAEMESLISALEKNANQDAIWLLFGAFLITQNCPYPLRARIKKLIESIKWENLDISEQARTVATIALAAHAWPTGGADLANRMQQNIFENARLFSQSDETAGSRQSKSILLAVEALARHSPPSEAGRIFSNALAGCVDQWKDLASQIPGLLQLLALSDEQLVSMWPCILRIRHNAARRQSAPADDETDPLF